MPTIEYIGIKLVNVEEEIYVVLIATITINIGEPMPVVLPSPNKTYLLVASSIELYTPGREVISLSKAEWRALALFAAAKEGVPLKDSDFLDVVPLRSVGVLINALRKKLGTEAIKNVRGQGYVINKNLMILRPTWSRPKSPTPEVPKTPTAQIQMSEQQ